MSASPEDPSASKEPPPDDLGATTVDREAMSFEDLEALAEARDADAPSATAEREVVGPKWAGTLPSVAVPASASPAPAPAIVAPAPPVEAAVVAPVEPVNLAGTSLHRALFG